MVMSLKDVVDEATAYAPQARRLTRIQAAPTRSVSKPKPKKDYGTVQIDLPHPIATHIRNFGGLIPDSDLAKDGREDNPHVTIKYGLKTDDPKAVRAVFADEPPIKMQFGKTSLFNTDEHDVVKVAVYSQALHRLNKSVSDAVEHDDTFPTYKPHATIAYVKPGEGKKYTKKAFLKGQKAEANYVTFISSKGERTDIPLKTDKGQVNVTQKSDIQMDVSKTEYKYTPLAEFKMGDEGNGTLEGYANTSGEVDDGGDIVTGYDDLEGWKQNGWMAQSHDWSMNGVVGMPVDARVDAKGLWAKAAFHSTSDAQMVRTKAKERMDAGLQVGLSIGYAPSGDVKFLYPADYDTELPKLVTPERLQANLATARQFSRVRVLRVKMKEFSIVTSPMNRTSTAVAVKGVKEMANEDKGAHGAPKLGFAPRDRAWDSGAAEKRVRAKTGADEAPNAAYSRCFLWSDSEDESKFGSFKFLICDAVGDELKIIPRAVFACAGILQGSRGGTSIPEADQSKIKSTISGLYKRMAKTFEDDTLIAPWDKKEDGTRNYKDEFTEALVSREANEQAWELTSALCSGTQDLLDDIDEDESDIEDPIAELRSMLASFSEAYLAAITPAIEALMAGEATEGPEAANGKAINGGLRLTDQFTKMLTEADAMLARFTDYKELRFKDGREIGAGNRQRMRGMMDRMKQVIDHAQTTHDALKAMCDASEPQKEVEATDPDQVFLRFQRLRFETAAML
jgi:2'-5' RNA ligase